MASQPTKKAAKGSKSSLIDHTFPPFYACYLLKSIRTPRATATYIGSTPSPPRRIRQHNGEIAQGAMKTKYNRPWVMQMIVHGFPSKLAALQFEWAWQHPHISRHLRDDSGKNTVASSGRYLKANVLIARTMLVSHPYTTWPLRVTFFTAEALKVWQGLADVPLPPGFQYTIEFEGVDGKSGQPGSGRTCPIDVTDKIFTEAHLVKHRAVLKAQDLACSVCGEPVADYDQNPLDVALCPAPGACAAVAHLTCLAGAFRTDEGAVTMIPRGGRCRGCGEYTLWGDIVRGCYRRKAGSASATKASAAQQMEDEEEGAEGEVFGEHLKEGAPPTPSQPQKKPRRPRKVPALHDGELESFDLDAVSSASEESDEPPNRPRGGPRKDAVVLARPNKSRAKSPASPGPSLPKKKPGRPRKVPALHDGELESFDLDAVSSASEECDETPKRPCGRLKKDAASLARPAKAPAPPLLGNSKARGAATGVPLGELESFDLDAVSSASEESDGPPNRPRGFPRKDATALARPKKSPTNAPASPMSRPGKSKARGAAVATSGLDDIGLLYVPKGLEPLSAASSAPRARPPRRVLPEPSAPRTKTNPEYGMMRVPPRAKPAMRRRLVVEEGEVDFFEEHSRSPQRPQARGPADLDELPLYASDSEQELPQGARSFFEREQALYNSDSDGCGAVAQAMSHLSVSSPEPAEVIVLSD